MFEAYQQIPLFNNRTDWYWGVLVTSQLDIVKLVRALVRSGFLASALRLDVHGPGWLECYPENIHITMYGDRDECGYNIAGEFCDIPLDLFLSDVDRDWTKIWFPPPSTDNSLSQAIKLARNLGRDLYWRGKIISI